MDKVILVICDGIGDRPIPKFKGKTPLETARTPNLNRFARAGISGVIHTIDRGIRPGSDTAHLSLFGYDPETHYTGRGPFEVAGIDMSTKPGDICLRVNMGTVDKDMTVVDRRAGRIDDTSEFAKKFTNTKIRGVTFILKAGTGHRLGMIMRGKNLSGNFTDPDPHEVGMKVYQAIPLDKLPKTKRTASILNTFLKKTHPALQNLASNKKRAKQGKLPANYFLARGAGKYPKLKSFKDKYGLKAVGIAGAGLYKGIAKALRMDAPDIKGATGKPNSNLKVKIKTALKLLPRYDFTYIHLKGADTLGEDGDPQGKKQFIEKIDIALKPLLTLKNTLIAITADHSTPCALKAHSADDVPITIKYPQVRDDDVKRFSERDCAKGRLGHICGRDLMPIIMDLLGKSPLYGA